MTQYELITLFAKYGSRAFNLSPANQLFMLTLLSYWNHETNECYPSNESVQDGCGIDASNLSKNKKVLTAAGLIKTYNKPMGDKKKHSGYVLNISFITDSLSKVANEVDEMNCIKFNQSGIDLFKQEEQEQVAPWEETVEEAVAAVAASLPEKQNAKTLAIKLNAEISAVESVHITSQEEKPMAIAPDELQKMMEEADRLRRERQERIAKRDNQPVPDIDEKSPW